MKRFEFSLETVLKLRVSQEREWENQLASITGECERIRKSIVDFEAEKNRCAVENQFRDVNSLMAVANYQARMDSQVRKAQKQLVLKERERESVLKDFIEASKKRKILDKLKEKKMDEYHHLRNKFDEKMNDDINNSVYGNQRRI
ncbi:MAG: flagellar export protein FliJ [Spirochaetaceae bacterium]|nr:flagellar export protein FliJ [Spirochaetaceae bacterium]